MENQNNEKEAVDQIYNYAADLLVNRKRDADEVGRAWLIILQVFRTF